MPAQCRWRRRSRPWIAASACTRSGLAPRKDQKYPSAPRSSRAAARSIAAGLGGGGLGGGGVGGGAGGGFGGGGFGGGGGGFRRGIDEDTLRQVSEMTGGAYYSAESASELQDVFQNLPTYLITKHEIMEISVAFTAIGTLLAVIAVALSL